MTDEITEVHELTLACSQLLAGHSPHVVGAVLADLTATYLAGHIDLDSPEDTDQLRADLLEMHTEAVIRLIPINEKMIRDHIKKAAH